jgi:hypothetical protein
MYWRRLQMKWDYKRNRVGSVGVTTAEIFGGKRLTQAVLSGRAVFLGLITNK